MRGPQIEGTAHLVSIRAEIVDSGDAALVAGLMIQNLLDDVRLDTEFGHVSCGRSAEIMKPPGRYFSVAIQCALGN